jgi:tetratricopeptide (TPR) repeat protein
MTAGRSTAIVALAIGIVASSGSFAFAKDEEGVDTVARALFDAARQAASVGDWKSATAYLGEAESRNPLDSDVLYLGALAKVKQGLPFADALGDLNASLAADRFLYYRTRDASNLKAEILVREGRWQEALDALGPSSPASAVDPSFLQIRARAYAGMGNIDAFVAELREAFARFPDDPSFPRLFLSRAGKVPFSEASRELGKTILSRLSRYSTVDPELPVLAAPLMADISARRDAVLAFRAAGGSSPAATLRALEYGIVDEAAAAKEFLSGPGPIELRDLGSLLALAGSPAGRDEVVSALAAWSGKVESDSDGDGIAEASFSVDKGLVTDWAFDSRREGMEDERGAFVEGLPSSITLYRGDVEIDVAYSAYPAVASVAFVEKTVKRGFSFSPEAFVFAPVAMRPFAGEGKSAIYFPSPNPVDDPTETSCAARALSVAVDSGTSREVTLLDKGTPLSSTTYRDGRLYSTTSYQAGRPVLEKADVDGDGRFETERGFYVRPDGSSDIAWVRIDSAGDGVFDYYEQTVFPFRKEWDFDRDGLVDAVQFQLSDGSIEQQFSSRLDGRLDESLVVKGGTIVALSRNGVSLALVPDSNPQLTWIGRKSFDLGRNLPAGEGLFSGMGMRYRLTRIGDRAFAELIP